MSDKLDKQIIETATQISKSWGSTGKNNRRPIVLILGGLQGSGKTTLVDNTQKELKTVNIDLDEIRNILFNKGIIFSKKFIRLVDEIGDELIIRAIGERRSMVIDTNNAKLNRVEKIKRLIKSGGIEYDIFTVFLKADYKQTIERIENRVKRDSAYLGTVEEYLEEIKGNTKSDIDMFELVIDTSKEPEDSVARKVLEYIK